MRAQGCLAGHHAGAYSNQALLRAEASVRPGLCGRLAQRTSEGLPLSWLLGSVLGSLACVHPPPSASSSRGFSRVCLHGSFL